MTARDAEKWPKHVVGFAPMGCYIIREDRETAETVRVGIKSYAQAVKMANQLDKEAQNDRP